MEQQLTIPRYEIDIFWSDEDDAFVANVPELPYCSAWGETYEEALSEIQSAIRGHIKVAQKYGNPIPEPRPPRAVDGSDSLQQTEEAIWSGTLAAHPEGAVPYIDTVAKILQDQQQTFQDLVHQSANAYSDFLNSALSFYQQTLQAATQVAQNNVQAATQATQQGVQAASQAAQQNTEAANQAAQESDNAAGQAGRKPHQSAC